MYPTQPYQPSFRFKHDCRDCEYRLATSSVASTGCHACILRNIYTAEDVQCCIFCKYPRPDGATCPSCAQLTFDGRLSYLASLDVCGIGNTDGDWRDRTWRELGGAVMGAKGNQPYFFEPLRRLMLYHLDKSRQLAGMDLYTYVPTTNPLLPRLFEAVQQHAARLGAAGAFDGGIVAKNTTETFGDRRWSPKERWAYFHAHGLYQVTEPKAVQGRRVWMMEDVYKSGCATEITAKRLLEAGAAEVHGFALCRWPLKGTPVLLRPAF